MRRCSHLARTALLAAALASAPLATRAAGFALFSGDPIDPATSEPYMILPGLPLMIPQQGHGGRPVVDATRIGDVDIVVRAGTPFVGPTIPPPAAVPPSVVAGGTHLTNGTELSFRVIASDGAPSPAAGNPLPGAELDGLPVIVFAYADLDRDGFVGPTSADVGGSADDAREEQEALFPVGRTAAVFTNGVATGSLAIGKGAPASAGGLPIVLTAVAYIGPFDGFLSNNVPHGPGVATMLPLFPITDPTKVLDGDGAGGRADAEVRIDVTLAPEFDLPVNDPDLGTPFVLPTDGSSITVDRAVSASASFARARFVRPSDVTEFVAGAQVLSPLLPGAGNTLYAPLAGVTLADDGPGGGVTVRLVPVDRQDDITDPAPGTTVTLLAGPGLVIASPDTDADPARETVALSDAAGVAITIDDAGGLNDSGAASVVHVSFDGFATESLAVTLSPGGGPTTTTPTTTTTVPGPTTTVPGTTTTVPGTTTTTIPVGCGTLPTFPSIGCRIDALRLALQHDVPAGTIQMSVLLYVDKADAAVEAAATQSSGGGARRMTRSALKMAASAISRVRSKISSRAGRALIEPSALARLVADATQLITDLRTLRSTL